MNTISSFCSTHWFKVGGIHLEKGDVMYAHAPIRVYLNEHLRTVVELCVYAVRSIKPDQTTPEQS